MPTETDQVEEVKVPADFNPMGNFLKTINQTPSSEDKKKDEDDQSDLKKDDVKKPSKEDNFAALKKKKEEAEKELERVKKELEKASSLKKLDPVYEYIKKKTGKEDIEESDVTDFIEKNKNRKKTLQELDSKYKEKDRRLKELEIESSDEWKNVYQKGISDSSSAFTATVINVDVDGKPRAPKATNKFINAIASLDDKGNSKTPLEIKALMSQFKKEFEDEAGIEYEAPSINELTKSLESYHHSVRKAVKAKQDWEKSKEELAREKLYEESQKQKAYSKKEIEGRDFAVKKLRESDSFKVVKTIFGEELDVNNIINEEHTFMNDIMLGKEGVKPRGYDVFIKTMAEARVLPHALDKIEKQAKEIERLKEVVNSGLPRKVKSLSNDDHQAKDDGDIKLKPGEKFDPRRMFAV